MRIFIYEYVNSSKRIYKTYLDENYIGYCWTLEVDIPEILHPFISSGVPHIKPDNSPVVVLNLSGSNSPRVCWTDNAGKWHYKSLPVLSRTQLGSGIFI